MFMLLNTFADGNETIVSRGELIEIGGAFRIPDILAKSGSVLVEVGTTNRTRLSDYRLALSPNTRVLLKVHQSNFLQLGDVHHRVYLVVCLGHFDSSLYSLPVVSSALRRFLTFKLFDSRFEQPGKFIQQRSQ